MIFLYKGCFLFSEIVTTIVLSILLLTTLPILTFLLPLVSSIINPPFENYHCFFATHLSIVIFKLRFHITVVVQFLFKGSQHFTSQNVAGLKSKFILRLCLEFIKILMSPFL